MFPVLFGPNAHTMHMHVHILVLIHLHTDSITLIYTYTYPIHVLHVHIIQILTHTFAYINAYVHSAQIQHPNACAPLLRTYTPRDRQIDRWRTESAQTDIQTLSRSVICCLTGIHRLVYLISPLSWAFSDHFKYGPVAQVRKSDHQHGGCPLPRPVGVFFLRNPTNVTEQAFGKPCCS